MAKVLFVFGGADHPHNYGVDHLYTGFCELLGSENVFDYPEKPCLHLPSIEQRDECNIDSDAAFPVKEMEVEDMIRQVDLAIMAEQPAGNNWKRIAETCRLLPSSIPLAAYDATDIVQDFRRVYEDIAEREVSFWFMREVPLDKNWAIPLPLSYPMSRVPDPMPEKRHQFFYHASTHNGTAPGVVRKSVIGRLQEMLDAGMCDIGLYPHQTDRPLPEEYHRRMAESLITFSHNGATNWDCNRVWESLAFGLAVVSEHARIKIPGPIPFIETYTPDEIVERVVELAHDEALARDTARRQHEIFRQHHCSEARARYVLQQCGLEVN